VIELALIIAATVWAKTAAFLWLRQAPSADDRYARGLLVGILFAAWFYGCVEIVPSPLNAFGPLFPSLRMLRFASALVGAAAALGLWAAGHRAPERAAALAARVPRGRWFLVLPALVLIAPVVYRAATYPRAAWSVERLESAARGEDPRAARRAVDMLGYKGEEGVPALERALGVPGLSEQAVHSLSRIGTPAIGALKEAAASPDADTAALAGEALKKMGPAAQRE
jgi:hypothetical protein